MYYFLSDTHLGIDTESSSSMERERMLVRWLEEVSADADAIFLVGDIFDFWFEYNRVIPKGHTRLLGKLSELTDRGVEVHLFVGNHDKWADEYLSEECGVRVHKRGEVMALNGKRLLVAHGDNMPGAGRRSILESIMQWVFHSQGLRRIYSALTHPNFTMRLGRWWSHKSRKLSGLSNPFAGEQEYLVRYARKYQQEHRDAPIDYFVFGHIHSAVKYGLGDGSHVAFLGEWLSDPTYATMDDRGEIELKKYS